MSKQTLTFPTGDFSHTDFAKLNGKTNQQVWTVYSEARKTGQIIPANPPERKSNGKGKPTLMWIVNPNYVAPVVPATPATPVVSTATVTPATPPVVLTDEQLAAIAQQQAADRAAKEAAKAQAKADKEAKKAADKLAKEAAKAQAKADKLAAKAAAKAAKEAAAVPSEPVTVAAAAPVTPPTVETPAVVTEPVAETVTVPVVEVAPAAASAPLPEVTPASAPTEQPFVVAAVVAEAPVETGTVQTFQGRPVTDTREINETCPICGSKCLAADNDTGVYVWCAAPINVCSANENPYGHGNNEKAAYAILVAKYGKKS